MSTPRTITIDEVQYVRADSVAEPSGDRVIVVLPRGFIYFGKLERSDGWCRLTCASNIRKWSSGGFGGLTLGAKSSGATLDKCGPVEFSMDAVVSIHPVTDGWADA